METTINLNEIVNIVNQNKRLSKELSEAHTEITHLKKRFCEENIEFFIETETEKRVENIIKAIFQKLGFNNHSFASVIIQNKEYKDKMGEPNWWSKTANIEHVELAVNLEKNLKHAFIKIGCKI